jgi:hypothetical protein
MPKVDTFASQVRVHKIESQADTFVRSTIHDCMDDYYEDVEPLLDTVVCEGDEFLYIERRGSIASFFISGVRTLNIGQTKLHTRFLGLIGSRPQYANSPLRYFLVRYVARRFERTGVEKLAWGLTATAPSLRVAQLCFDNVQPLTPEQDLTEWEPTINEIRLTLGATERGDNPWVLRGFSDYRLKRAERERQEAFDRSRQVFDSWHVRESRGDRLIFVCWKNRIQEEAAL